MDTARRAKVGMQGKASRRDVLKTGAALGLAGLGVFSPHVARAAGTHVNIINATGNFALALQVLMKELKLFEKYELEADQISVSDNNKILAGLISGDGDICPGAGFNALFPAIEKGGTIKILAGAGLAPLNIMYSTRSNIKSVKDLPGHTVATGAPGALLHALAVAVMKKYGVDYKSVSFVNAGSGNDIFKALVAGTVDAGVAPIEFRDTAAKYNLYPLVDGEFWKELPLWTNQAMFTSDRAIAANRKGIVGVLAVNCDMFRWLAKPENKPAWRKYYTQAITNASDAEADFLFDFVSAPGHLATGLVLTPEQIKYVQDLNVELGVQKAVLPFDKCADMSLAAEALKLVKA
jgi:hypothetical protein